MRQRPTPQHSPLPGYFSTNTQSPHPPATTPRNIFQPPPPNPPSLRLTAPDSPTLPQVLLALHQAHGTQATPTDPHPGLWLVPSTTLTTQQREYDALQLVP